MAYYSRLSQALAIVLSLSTACGPLSNLSKKSHSQQASHLAGSDDEDDPDDDDDDSADAGIDAALKDFIREIHVHLDEQKDGPPIYVNVGDSDGIDIGTVTNTYTPVRSSSLTTTDLSDEDKVDVDELSDILDSLKADMSHFTDDNKGIQATGNAARGASIPPPPQVTPTDYPFQTPVGSDNGQRLAQAWQYEKAAKNSFSANDPRFAQRKQLVGAADNGLHQADSAFVKGARAEAEFLMKASIVALDIAVGISPVGWANFGYQAITGFDFFTNQPLNAFAQGVAITLFTVSVGVMVLGSAEISLPVSAGVTLIGSILNRAGTSESAAAALLTAQVIAKSVFSTLPGEALFWTALGPEGADIAAQYASANGGTTLEQLCAERGIVLPDWGNGKDPAVVAVWENASREFAQNASGTVAVLLGDSPRPNSVWLTVELPALQANSKVTEVLQIDATIGKTTQIYKR